MSTSKKPGTDLAALKARLAKKKGKSAPAPEAAAPQAAAPAVEEPLPPPGRPAPEPVAQAAPAADPAPVEPAAPVAPAAQAAPAAQPTAPSPSDDPFGGGGAFDPSAGVLDDASLDVKPKGSLGLILFAGIVGLGIGAVGGSLGKEVLDKGDKREVASAKGAKMHAAAEGLSKARIEVSKAIDGWKAKMATKPGEVATEINALLKDKYEKQVRIDDLFGPDLAAVHSKGIKRTFELYDESARLKKDLHLLASFLAVNKTKIVKGMGPALFGIEFKAGLNSMVAVTGALCGESLEAAKACVGEQGKNAIAYMVLDDVGQTKARTVARGTQPGQVQLLSPTGGIFGFAVGLEPNKHAIAVAASLVQRTEGHIESMVKAEKSALSALKNYAGNTDANPQPEPESDAE